MFGLWCLGLLGLSLLGGLPFWLLTHASTTDYATEPPEKAFERAFKRPVPPGVSDIRAAGMASLGGASVWIRFKATDAAIAEFTRGSQREPDAVDVRDDFFAFWTREGAPGSVGLGGLLAARDPEYYVFQQNRSIWEWVRIIVDRPRNLVYVHWTYH